ncbi:MAG: GspE/PulE family protein [Bdellovibrionales bacterium]
MNMKNDDFGGDIDISGLSIISEDEAVQSVAQEENAESEQVKVRVLESDSPVSEGDNPADNEALSFIDLTIEGDDLGNIPETQAPAEDSFQITDTPEPAPEKPAEEVPDTSTGTQLAVLPGSLADAKVQDGVEKKARIGDLMVQQGVITEDQLHVALHEQSISGRLLGEVFVSLGFVTSEVLMQFIAEASGSEVFDPKTTIFDGEVLKLVNRKVATQYKILPISMNEREFRVAMADPYDVLALDTLKRFIPKSLKIKSLVAKVSVINDAIDAAYGYASSVNAILKELENAGEQVDVTTLSEDEAFSHPIVRLVNALVFEAVKIGASDLHFEPEENFIRLRYRKDGALFTAQIIHKQHWSGISQRLKIMCNMNIADKLSPQDGRFGMNVGGREADFRVSSLPTVHGENIVLRVLDQTESIMPMEKLGFSEHNLNLIKKSQARPEGIVIVTGPTGSGKTTSLYSMLNEINDVEVNIQTLEDPVEYSLPMIRQTHVQEGVLEFADGIKALLRQDPDIIFIGEIRDKTTAEMALKAAMTGHQVYTTLHTNDSFGAIPRLMDLGLKPGMVSGALVSIFAQRLTRRLCQSCKEGYRADEQECEILGADPNDPPEIFRARQGGCESCDGKGYKGRTAVVEILYIDEDIDELIAKNESKAALKALAVKKGFKSMKDDGILKVREGVTSFQALAKVVDVTK